MVVKAFVCADCGTLLTRPLTELGGMPSRPTFDGRKDEGGLRRAPATIPRGAWAREPEPWGAPFAGTSEPIAACSGMPCIGGDLGSDDFLVSVGPRETIVLHPDDTPFLLRHPDDRHFGC